MAGLVWRERESILRSKYDFFDGAAGFVENCKPAAITAADAVNNYIVGHSIN